MPFYFHCFALLLRLEITQNSAFSIERKTHLVTLIYSKGYRVSKQVWNIPKLSKII